MLANTFAAFNPEVSLPNLFFVISALRTAKAGKTHDNFGIMFRSSVWVTLALAKKRGDGG
jgi:hypothetical protein